MNREPIDEVLEHADVLADAFGPLDLSAIEAQARRRSAADEVDAHAGRPDDIHTEAVRAAAAERSASLRELAEAIRTARSQNVSWEEIGAALDAHEFCAEDAEDPAADGGAAEDDPDADAPTGRA